jgi:hypothetical protein
MEIPELQNLIWEYTDDPCPKDRYAPSSTMPADTLVVRRCSLGNPQIKYVIDWKHRALHEINAMIYVRRFFPLYWSRSISDQDYRRIYESAKGYYVRMALRGIDVRVM